MQKFGQQAYKISQVFGCRKKTSTASHNFRLHSVERKKKTAEHLGKQVIETFLKAIISLYKLENDHMKAFMHEFIEGVMLLTPDLGLIFYCRAGDNPCVKVLKEKHFPTVKQERENALREKVRGKQVAVLKVAENFVLLFKITDSTDKIDIFVGDVHALETANTKNCSRAILDTLNNVLVLVSDSAKYMVKCFDSLKNITADHVLVIQSWAQSSI
ncbi:hypothetical protein PR048_009334 [Dryococelus australis]|uniref:Uncharacterized protein n=1 Tax=Dryococelus australis TaxID=614101 RepID=A0ABQ9HZN1_9NEOP|nr:hypothetical protein PR048_009334 [Dryococelus australis]